MNDQPINGRNRPLNGNNHVQAVNGSKGPSPGQPRISFPPSPPSPPEVITALIPRQSLAALFKEVVSDVVGERLAEFKQEMATLVKPKESSTVPPGNSGDGVNSPEFSAQLPLLKAMMDVIVNVERSIARLSNPVTQGDLYFHPDSTMTLEEIRQDLLVALFNVGVEPFSVQEGERLDGTRHHPMAQITTVDPAMNQRIASQISPGYRLIKTKVAIHKAVVRVYAAKKKVSE